MGGVAATITCGMIVVGPPFYTMYVVLPKIMVRFSIVPPERDKGGELRHG
jgi:hypothetical protein